MAAAYKDSRASVFYFILNTFTLNIILLNLILATFYFYYQSFYTESVKKVNARTGLLQILSHFKGKNIEDKQLKYIVETYSDNNEVKFDDLSREYFKQPIGAQKSGIDAYNILITMQNNYIYQLTQGVLSIVIVCLTMSSIDIFLKA